MKNYEALVLVRPDLSDQDLDKEISKLSQTISQNKGEFGNCDKWAKRSLAYKIKKFQDGIYLLISFKAEPSTLINIERVWKLDENVLRDMITVKS
jgi:small subunit ribosomal protein S6